MKTAHKASFGNGRPGKKKTTAQRKTQQQQQQYKEKGVYKGREIRHRPHDYNGTDEE